jgi:Ca2+-binding RTX toxin-like protein
MVIVEKKDGELYASTTNGGRQTEPRVAALPSGGYVVVWESDTGADIRAQRFDASGAKVGSEIVVADSSVVNRDPDVVVTASGDFVIAWKTQNAQSHFYVAAQRYAADGTPLGTTMAVTPPNGFTFDTYARPAGFALPGGGFVLTWQSGAVGTRAQVYDSAGAKVGAEMLLDPGNGGHALGTAIGADRFVLVWKSMAPDGPNGQSQRYKSQVFDSAGDKIGAEVVHAAGFGATVAALADGGFAVATLGFVVLGGTNGYSVVNVQRFDSDGAMVGAQIQVAAGGSGVPPHVKEADIVGVASGGFIVAWHEHNNSVSLRGQLFDASGAKVNSAFAINAETMASEPNSSERRVDLARLESGQIVAVWSNEAGGNALQLGIKAQLLLIRTEGTSGDDLLEGTSANDLIHAFAGDDEVFGGEGDDELYGGDGADVLSGGSGNDTLNGGSGVDSFDGGADFVALGDNIGHGDGVSFFDASATQGAVADLRDGTISNDGFGNSETMTGIESLGDGTAFADTFHGNDSINFLWASLGDSLYGHGGDDHLHLNAAATVVEGGSGVDRLQLNSRGVVLLPDSNGDGLAEVVPAMTAGWNVDLGAGTLRDGYGNVGTVAGIENLIGSQLGDELRGEGGANRIEGGAGNDFLLLHDGGDDTAHGGEGNDVLYFGSALSAGDVADGGEGRDAIVLQGNVTAVLTNTNLVGIESISIQSGANTRFGDTANNFYDYHVTTADGNVTAGQQLIVNAQSLRPGEDFTFDGSAESDGKFLVYGGHGVDNLTGGAGADVFLFEGTRWGANDKVDGGAGRDALVISAGSGLTRIEFGADSLANIESISLNNRYATDPSQKPSYELVLHNGNVAPGGTLIVNGSSIPAGQLVNIDGRGVQGGHLILFGGGGHDTLFGGDGNDLILGGGGADALTGGAGSDTFRYDAASDSNAGLPDLIGDFQTGVDKIDLSRIDANTHLDGNQAFAWIGSNAFSGTGAASAGELRVFDDNGRQRIEGDTNGDGVADLVIVLQVGTAPVVQGDFLP